MSKFNKVQTISERLENRPDATRNAEGGLSFAMNAKTRLYTQVASALVGEQTYYKSASEKDSELISTLREVIAIDPEFVLKLAYYTRSKLYLRSVTTLMLNELANSGISVPDSRKYVASCIQRPDDMTELVSLALNRNGKKGKLPMLIKNGVRNAFPKFDAYQLGKYNRNGNVKLRDVMFLTHPKPNNDSQKIVWSKLIDGTLETPVTWETQRSAGLMTWPEVLRNVFHKGGKTNNYMAIIRNLRNLVSSGLTSEDMGLLCQMIQDENAIRYSKMLPFRYMSAYSELRNCDFQGRDISDLYEALENAVNISVCNVDKLPGTTVVAIDVSGSMDSKISGNSTVNAGQIATMLGMMSRSLCEDPRVVLFNTRTSWRNLPDKQILRNAYEVRNPAGGTYGHIVIDDMLNMKLTADRLIFLTDMVLYSDWGTADSCAKSWVNYQRSPYGKNCKMYNVDLTGYGLSTVPQNMKDTRTIAGWSDRIFEMINLLENSSTAVDEIQKISL